MEVVIGSDILRGLSRKTDTKKRQLPTIGNWRNKNTYYFADLDGMIILIDSHTSPEEEQDFFYLMKLMGAMNDDNCHGGILLCTALLIA